VLAGCGKIKSTRKVYKSSMQVTCRRDSGGGTKVPEKAAAEARRNSEKGKFGKRGSSAGGGGADFGKGQR